MCARQTISFHESYSVASRRVVAIDNFGVTSGPPVQRRFRRILKFHKTGFIIGVGLITWQSETSRGKRHVAHRSTCINVRAEKISGTDDAKTIRLCVNYSTTSADAKLILDGNCPFIYIYTRARSFLLHRATIATTNNDKHSFIERN